VNASSPVSSLEPSERAALDALGNRLRPAIPEIEWAVHAPLVHAIQEWKRKRNAVVLAHNYQTPEIYHGVADIRGDSLALAREAEAVEANVIVLCGVYFMAETAKILNPGKTVLIPDPAAGCSLADSITARDVRDLRAKHPGIPVVAYVNTSADVKAECDICCTSANAVEVVDSLGVPEVIFLPDGYLARYVASQTPVRVIRWEGRCEVHERFSGADIRGLRERIPGIHIVAHPECSPEVLAESNYVGSTSGMVTHLKATGARRVALITECSMSDNVSVELPNVEFVRPCNLCPHMKRNSLAKILWSLQEMTHEVSVPEEVGMRARRAIERMLAVPRTRNQ
jgi:quinolinate synthase